VFQKKTHYTSKKKGQVFFNTCPRIGFFFETYSYVRLLDLSSFKKHLYEMLFFCYFRLKNNSINRLFSDFLKKTSKKIAISYKYF